MLLKFGRVKYPNTNDKTFEYSFLIKRHTTFHVWLYDNDEQPRWPDEWNDAADPGWVGHYPEGQQHDGSAARRPARPGPVPMHQPWQGESQCQPLAQSLAACLPSSANDMCAQRDLGWCVCDGQPFADVGT